MDVLLGKVTQQAVNYAIRTGVTISASFAIQQSRRFLKSAPASDSTNEVDALQQKLHHKLKIVSPAIDMIELMAARGNSSLSSAVALTTDLRYEIQSLGTRLAKAAAASEQSRSSGAKWTKTLELQYESELQSIAKTIRQLLQRIEDAVPLINLAITTSGAKLSSQLPSTVSPSRLLQASALLNTGDHQYRQAPNNAVQIGPTFRLTVYMLFAGHIRPQTEEDIRETTWKEVIHKARVKLRRVPLDVIMSTGSGSQAIPQSNIIASSRQSSDPQYSKIPADARADEYGYQIMIVEDFDDDRVHDFENDDHKPGAFDDVSLAGIRETIPIHEISKIFYADTGKVLNISTESDHHHPVLLLKRDVNAVPPRRMVDKSEVGELSTEENGVEQAANIAASRSQEGQQDDDPWRFPPSLDPEWIAFEIYSGDESDESASESDPNDEPDLNTAVSNLSIRSPASETAASNSALLSSTSSSNPNLISASSWANHVQTSLSLFELLLRLTSLQQFQQASHLSIPDELLNFFLEESATTGAGGDEAHRQALRTDARRRVGWDPYDESPLKRRGEEYQYHQPYSPSYAEQYSREGTPSRHHGAYDIHSGKAMSPSPGRGGEGGAQTRSMTGFSSDSNYSPSPAAKGRPSNMKRQGSTGQGRHGSPLRQTSGRDEGLGTSPASARLQK